MKRYFSIIAIMALVVCMFAGCGSKKSNTSSNANSGTSSSERAQKVQMQARIFLRQMIQSSFQASIMLL